MKQCSKCGQVKPTEAFYKGRPDCKECKKALSRKHYSAHRKNYVEYSRQYRLDNYQQTLETARRYRAAHLAERREYEAEYERKRLASRSKRVQRIKTLIQHYKGREGWLDLLASIVGSRDDAHGLSWISSDIDDLLRIHYFKE